MKIKYVSYFLDYDNFLLGEVPDDSIKHGTGMTDIFVTKIIVGGSAENYYSNETYPHVKIADLSKKGSVYRLKSNWVAFNSDIYNTYQEALRNFMKAANKKNIIKAILVENR